MSGTTTLEANLQAIHPNAAGIDIGATEHWVSVPPGRDEESVRRFGCFTPDLYALADWLKACQIETVAMEATGVYWIPLFQILETRGFAVILVNAHHVKTVPGRKSDVLDCQWLRQLHSYGLLAGSFRPDDTSCVLRSYLRHRDTLIKSASTHVLRMQKALDQMNLHLHRVISDITGVSGMAMLQAIVAGERDPHVLAGMKHPLVKASHDEIVAALSGDYRAEHLFVLQQELELYTFYQQQMAHCDLEIEAYLNRLPDQVDLATDPPPKPKRGSKRPQSNSPAFDVHSHLYRLCGVDLTQIPGLGASSVLTILSEVGFDPTPFPSANHFVSWLGLCPGSRVSGGKVKSAKTRPVANRAATAFRIAAQTLSRSQSALGAFYRRMQTRLGKPKAITATAHKIARIFYHLWSRRTPYVETGAEVAEQRYRQQALKQLQQKALVLGMEVVPLTQDSALVS
jgi:transposase